MLEITAHVHLRECCQEQLGKLDKARSHLEPTPPNLKENLGNLPVHIALQQAHSLLRKQSQEHSSKASRIQQTCANLCRVHTEEHLAEGATTEGRLWSTLVDLFENVVSVVTASSTREISEDGLRFIAEHEGFRGSLYEDVGGHCTIGYGHLLHRGPCTGDDRRRYANGISKDDAFALLQEDARSAAAAVQRHVTVPLNQNQFDALTSFAFNVGEGTFQRSSIVRRLNKGDYDSVPERLNLYVNSGEERNVPGLVRRRREEGERFQMP